MGRPVKPAWEHEIIASEFSATNPIPHRFSGLLGNLELDRSLRLLLHYNGASCNTFSMHDISNFKLHQIARSQLTVNGEIKQSEFPCPLRQLEAYADRPNLL